MELYDPHPDRKSGGIMPWAGLVLSIAAVVAIVGAAISWLVCPWTAAVWRTVVAPLIQSVRHAIGV
jgi:hypothetical protein